MKAGAGRYGVTVRIVNRAGAAMYDAMNDAMNDAMKHATKKTKVRRLPSPASQRLLWVLCVVPSLPIAARTPRACAEPAGVAAAAAAADWPGFGGPRRDGNVPALPARLDALKAAWTCRVAGPCDAGIAVAGGRVVFCDHDKVNDYYVCLDAATGAPRWKRTMPNGREMEFGTGPRATPLIFDGRAYVLSAFGELYCLRLADGRTAWETSFAKDFNVRRPPTWGYSPSPLIAGGKLIVAPGGRTTLAALDPATGKVLWRGAGDGVNYASFIAGTFGGVEQVVGYDAKTLGGWELATGKRLWSRDVEPGNGYLVPSPLDLGGRVFAANHPNGAMTLAFTAGGVPADEPSAANEDAGADVASPARSGDVVVVGTAPIVGLDAATLKPRWTLDDPKLLAGESHLLASDNRVIAFPGSGMAVLGEHDAKGLRVVGTAQLCGPTRAAPALWGGRLYLRDDQALYCYVLP